MSGSERILALLPAGPRASAAAWAVALAVLCAVLVPFRSDANVGAIVLLLLLPPLLATGAGMRVAAATAAATGVVFNFLFTHPYDSPRIASTASIAAFVVYIGVALLVATTVARMRAASAAAVRRAEEATLLQTVTVELIRNADLGPTLRSALAELVSALRLAGASLRTAAGAPGFAADAGASAGAAELADRLVHGGGAGIVPLRPAGGPVAFPLVARGGAIGVLAVDPGAGPLDDGQARAAEAAAGVMALALERARLADEAVRRRALEETDRLRTVLMQSVSHDLRTPLTAIRAAAGALRAAEAAPDARDALLADIEDEASRLDALVRDVLDLSRIEGGALVVRRAPTPLDDLLDDAVAAAGLEDDPRLVRRGDVDVALRTDETLLRQALANLLANAAEHGGGALEVVVAAGPDAVAIRVVDHGPGIPEAERRRVFEPYHRLRPEARGRGSGLGLAIARGFVEALGGSIAVEPTPGGGATFAVRLPAPALPGVAP